jgi:hypothetical protein
VSVTPTTRSSGGSSIFGNRNQNRGGNNGNSRTGNTGRGGGGTGGRSGSGGGSNTASADLPAGVTILPPEDQDLARYSMFSRERVIRYAPPTPPPESRPAPTVPVAPPPPLAVLRGTGLPKHGDASGKSAAMIEYADGTSQMVHVGDVIEGLKGGKIAVIDDLGVEIVGDDGKARRIALGQDLAGSEAGGRSTWSASGSSGSGSSESSTSSAPTGPMSSKEEEMRRRRQQENNR